ncbi:MAG: phosphate transport system regulatory protein PhoU [Actinobacteria bacterium RBG_13_35_12]|jgi:phosphate transport system protein|nr:MAG: phosphate transport system regulatory protein PhoU [Actinobacteria bacterium RBG_13_35_12]
MRETFHHKLEEINEDVILMGSLVQEAVYNSIEAFIEMNTDLAEKVINGDEKINESDILIEEKCIVLQAEHQPVAKDLRYLHSVSIIIKYLERIGDLAVNISKAVKRLAKEKKKYLDKEIMDLLVEMGNLVKPELNRALESFKNKDIKLASQLGKSDDMVDEIQKMIFRKLFSSHKCSEEDIKFITNIVLASRYLERIGDQSVNIGQRVLYFLSGDYRVFHDGV